MVKKSLTTETLAYEAPLQRKVFDIKKYNKFTDDKGFSFHHDFYAIANEARQYVYAIYDKKVQEKAAGETKEDYVSIYHEAMQGIPSSVSLIKKHIENFITEQGLRNTTFPEYYPNLVDAIFEEEFGWGPLSVFRYEHECEGAQVIGQDIKIKKTWGWELLPYRFKSMNKVYDVAQRFSNMNMGTVLNEHSQPEIETKTHDNIRVSIMIPGLMYTEPVITLRRKVIQDLSLMNLAEYGTFPKEAIPLLEALARFQVNSVIAGPPGCGKSTLLHAFLHYACYEFRNGKKIPERINTVYAESYAEFDARNLHPLANLLHMIGRGENFEKKIMASILRHDIARIVLGEIREHEVGLYRRASLQGIKQLMGTIHDLDPLNIPEIMGNLYMQYYPNGSDSRKVYETFARNLHFSITMDEFLFEQEEEEHLMKKVTGIHLYDVDPETHKIQLFTIMEYNSEEDTWFFNSTIPERFERIVSKYHRKHYHKFQSTLRALEEKGKLQAGE